jgi:uncharacterized protein
MKSKLLQNENGKTYAVVFEKGEEFISGLERFAWDEALTGSHFTAIGAFSDVTLAFFDRESKEYEKIPVHDQVEVLTLAGNVALHKGEHKIHAHVVIGKRDGTTLGGHVLEAHVWPTLELIVQESPHQLQRRHDPETGLPLIDVEL